MSRLQCPGDGSEIVEIGATSDTVTRPLIGRCQHPGPLIGRSGAQGSVAELEEWRWSRLSHETVSRESEYAVNTQTAQPEPELIKKMHDTHFYLHWLRCNSSTLSRTNLSQWEGSNFSSNQSEGKYKMPNNFIAYNEE